ncbi:MAG: hypothetical protein LBM97_01875 [Candidatus Nomurabacteria bacterium]|jgi:hypothetical protein|nr:hypothetical protein [Candidatus Nomurabacteria bacterium]
MASKKPAQIIKLNTTAEQALADILGIVLEPYEVGVLRDISFRKFRADIAIPADNTDAFIALYNELQAPTTLIMHNLAHNYLHGIVKQIIEFAVAFADTAKTLQHPYIALNYTATTTNNDLNIALKDQTGEDYYDISTEVKTISIIASAKSFEALADATILDIEQVRRTTQTQGAITYQQEVATHAEIAGISEQIAEIKGLLADGGGVASLEKELEKQGLRATPKYIDDITFDKVGNSKLIINGKEVVFDGSNVKVVMVAKAVFGRPRNLHKVMSAEELYSWCYPTEDWFNLSKGERTKFNTDVYQWFRQLNAKVGRAITGETDLINKVVGGYQVNQELLKPAK